MDTILKQSFSVAAQVPLTEVPRHVAVLMDGNRRWAKRRGLPMEAGHAAGVVALWRTVGAAIDLGIKTLTVFGFSTENWQRSEKEVEVLIERIAFALSRYTNDMVRQGVSFHTIGDLSPFPETVRQRLAATVEATAHGSQIDLVVALNYGGRNELCRAFRAIQNDIRAATVLPEAIDEALIAQYLDTAQWHDPELVIRTSGEYRLSNFLLWQMSYSEIVVSDVFWPDFGAEELYYAIRNYQNRHRRLGR